MTIAASPDRVAAATEIAGEVFAKTGAELVDPPAVQPVGPYLDLSGEDVRSRLYLVQDPEGRALCLRPDLTIPVCRMHVERGSKAAAAYRYAGKVYRWSPPDVGAPTEFVQVGLERIGAKDPAAAETEAVLLSLEAAKAAGAKVAELDLADAGLFDAFLAGLGVAGAAAARLKRTLAGGPDANGAKSSPLARALAGMSAEDAAAALMEVYAVAGVEPVGGRPTQAVAERLVAQAEAARTSALPKGAGALARQFGQIADAPGRALEKAAQMAVKAGVFLDERWSRWAERLDILGRAGVDLDAASFEIGFARQFSYYDGFTFEARDPALGRAQTLAAGGRYDRLLTRLGAADNTTAVGCMVRPGRLAASAERNS